MTDIRPYRATELVLQEIAGERVEQRGTWGQQDHPTGTRDVRRLIGDADLPTWGTLAYEGRLRCQYLADRGKVDWVAILFEEMAEFASSLNDEKAREELVQVAAVAVAAIEAIDRREEAEA